MMLFVSFSIVKCFIFDLLARLCRGQDIHHSGREHKQVKDAQHPEKFVTRWRLKRLEDVMAPASEEPITIKVEYVEVSGETVDGYEVVVSPSPRMRLAFGRRPPKGYPR